jgi:hypothetical protein
MSIHSTSTTSRRRGTIAFRRTARIAFALAAAATAGCVPHQQRGDTSVSPPKPADIIAENDVSVAAIQGLIFTVWGATLNVQPNSLEYDAMVRFALCRPSALPAQPPLPAGTKPLAVFYTMTDVRLSGAWPLDFQIESDFQDPSPDDPGFAVYQLDTGAGSYIRVADAVATPTAIRFGIVPGYFVVTVPEATPTSVGLVGSSPGAEIVFPSTVTADVDNALAMSAAGTDIDRLTNALSHGFVDRPYVSGDGRRLAIVRHCLDPSRGIADRLYTTTPSDPVMHLRKIADAQAGVPIGDVSFEPAGSSVLVAGALAGGVTQGSGVFRVPIAGGSPPELVYSDPGPTPPQSVACSTDGRMAVATSRFFSNAAPSGCFDVLIAPTSGAPGTGQLVRLTQGLHTPAGGGDPTAPLATVESLSFAPSGAAVYFGASVNGEYRVYRAAPDASALVELENLRGCRLPAIAPAGGSLVCVRNGQLALVSPIDGTPAFLGPPANGYGASLVSSRATKVSWLGQ